MYVSPNVVVGFHGCDKKVFDRVIKNNGKLLKSENSYDWLGHGVYFWEGSYERALEWAKESKKVKEPAVIGAFIKLGNCVDLLDSTDVNKVESTYKILKKEFEELGKKLPKNKRRVKDISFERELDCQVILRLQQLNNELIMQDLSLNNMEKENKRKIQNHPLFIDSVRGMFPEGNELYENAGFRAKNHIQICVINPNSIIGYFEISKHNSWFKKV